jgi:hypothetical protein
MNNKIGHFKIILNIFILISLIIVPLVVRALSFAPPGYDENTFSEKTGLGSQDPVFITISIIAWVLSFLGLAFLCLIIYGGFTWLFAGGNDDKIKKARGIMKNATIGLLIVVASYGIVNYIMWQLWAQTHF